MSIHRQITTLLSELDLGIFASEQVHPTRYLQQVMTGLKKKKT